MGFKTLPLLGQLQNLLLPLYFWGNVSLFVFNFARFLFWYILNFSSQNFVSRVSRWQRNSSKNSVGISTQIPLTRTTGFAYWSLKRNLKMSKVHSGTIKQINLKTYPRKTYPRKTNPHSRSFIIPQEFWPESKLYYIPSTLNGTPSKHWLSTVACTVKY